MSLGEMPALSRYFLGMALLAIIGLAARGLEGIVGLGSALVIAIALGALFGNIVGVSKRAAPGVNMDKLLLEIGIILMGATIAIDLVLVAGPRVLAAIAVAVPLSLLIVETLARWPFGVPAKVGSLLAAGTSICGVSAVAAVSGSINANGRQVAYAAGTVLLFDAITLTVYPLVGQLLGLTDLVYGVWAGLTMFSTGPVAAAGFAYSEPAGEWAVLVKLVRNSLVGFVAVGYAVYYSRRQTTAAESNKFRYLWQTFPKFILGFVLVAILANLFLPAERIDSLSSASNWMFLFAFAGLGLRIDVAQLRETGAAPAVIVGVSLVLISSLTLMLLLWLL